MNSFNDRFRGTLDFSVVIPVYREVASLKPIIDRLSSANRTGDTFEIIFVNDGNIENDVTRTLDDLATANSSVRLIHLARNFGQHAAIAAGIRNCRGSYVLVMDADLQYEPAEMLAMLHFARDKKRSAVISTIPARQGNFFRNLASRVFYSIMTILGVPQRKDLGSAFVINREVAYGLCKMHDRVRMTIPMVFWLVGEVSYFKVTHNERHDGKSGYNFVRLLTLAVRGAISFSTKPLYLAFVLAGIYGVVSIGLALRFLIGKLLWDEVYLTGWASTVVLISLSTAVILGTIGIIGLYLASIFDSTQGRPIYFVRNHADADLFED